MNKNFRSKETHMWKGLDYNDGWAKARNLIPEAPKYFKQSISSDIYTITENQVGRYFRDHLIYLFWQKLGLCKTAQHLVQLNHKNVQCWGTHCFPGENTPVADFSYCEKFSSCPIRISPGVDCTHYLSSFPCDPL